MPDEERWLLRRRPSRDFMVQMGDLEPILAKTLYARKYDTPELARAFLAGSRALDDPYRLTDMDRAVERIRQGIDRQERIVVYGDFDADGVSATALLVSALRRLGADVEAFIPDRFEDGYGLNVEAIDALIAEGARLLVTVDCGVRSIAEARHAAEQGVDMVITDHHSVPDELPPAVAVVNPKRSDGDYRFRSLAGVGVAYRLADALFARAGLPAGTSEELLDLVALGTVADIVPLEDENRSLVLDGLERMRQGGRPGLSALMEVSGVTPEALSSTDIAFRLGPRINAAGRLKHARLAYRLLLTDNMEEAQTLAAELNAVNEQRRSMLTEQTEWARKALGDLDERSALLVAGPDYHEGIVGLIASRLREEYYRPTLVMKVGDGLARGSARSIEGFHVTHALDKCSDLLLRYGGHSQAAGFTLRAADLERFCARFGELADEQIASENLQRTRRVDAIIDLAELSMDTPRALAQMEPFGEGNPEPALASRGLRIDALRRVGRDGDHLRMQVMGGKRSATCIGFRLGYLAETFCAGDQIDLVYRPTLNEWRGETSLQLEVSAMRRSA